MIFKIQVERTDNGYLTPSPPQRRIIGSPHLFGATSFICGAVGVIREPPSIKVFFLIFRMVI
ncbi:MAG TPA: hypothetical protein EYP47_03465 [Methanococcaceae archaeon]|uniref:Uncharacterized protein n=1 Tax=Methanothermococcus okinawensis TaxID=155863 RepID=A0A832ZM58_9EURY|nr:hypothetical protein [Methanococcaceae archaeon]HIP91431.1 hypothetical protein [Methanothermococcus okinawensis]